jgi:hypothetical protein
MEELAVTFILLYFFSAHGRVTSGLEGKHLSVTVFE